MWVYFVCLTYSFHALITYIAPWLWQEFESEYGYEERLRIRDAMSACVFDEIGGVAYMEWSFMPHDFAR